MGFWNTVVVCIATGSGAAFVAYTRGCAAGWRNSQEYTEAKNAGILAPQQQIQVEGWEARHKTLSVSAPPIQLADHQPI